MKEKSVETKGYVYLLGDWEKEHYYKIGVTKGTIERRIKSLQTGNGGEIYIVDYYQTDHPFFTEKHLHMRFGNKNVMNEWFELDLEDVKNFKEYCKKVDDLVNASKDNPFFPKNIR